MTIHTRTRVGNLLIDFNGSSSEAEANITYIRQTGNLPQIYVVKTATRTWDLYIKKMAYESGTVSRIDTSYYLKQRLTITWYDTYVASLPTGATPATVTNDWTTVVTSTTGSVSINLASTKDIYMVWAMSDDSNHFTTFSVHGFEGNFHIYDKMHGNGGTESISGNTLTVSTPTSGGGITVKYILIR